jgi:hypothetical protein
VPPPARAPLGAAELPEGDRCRVLRWLLQWRSVQMFADGLLDYVPRHGHEIVILA